MDVEKYLAGLFTQIRKYNEETVCYHSIFRNLIIGKRQGLERAIEILGNQDVSLKPTIERLKKEILNNDGS